MRLTWLKLHNFPGFFLISLGALVRITKFSLLNYSYLFKIFQFRYKPKTKMWMIFYLPMPSFPCKSNIFDTMHCCFSGEFSPRFGQSYFSFILIFTDIFFMCFTFFVFFLSITLFVVMMFLACPIAVFNTIDLRCTWFAKIFEVNILCNFMIMDLWNTSKINLMYLDAEIASCGNLAVDRPKFLQRCRYC